MYVTRSTGFAAAVSVFLVGAATAQEAAPAGDASSARPEITLAAAAAIATVDLAGAAEPDPLPPALDAASPAPSPEISAYPPVAASAPIAAAQYDDPWRFSITPYLFLPAIEGQLRFNPPPTNDGAPRVAIDAQDILEALNFAFMVTADAHYGRFGVMTDLMYVDLSAQNARVDQILRPGGIIDVPVDVDTSVDFNAWLWTGAFGVEFGDPGALTFEPFLGFRYMRNEVDLDWAFVGPVGQFPQTGSLTQEQNSWDGIAGVRGFVSLGEDSRWSVNYYGDVGAGDSELTWQVMGGVGYAFGWGDLRFAWRYIAYDQGDDAFLQDFNMNGPAFGATFRF
ncbi:hypothetical protein [Brevundimonas sp. Root1279]|uniref:hypothetical protein n=1 Tax=Brevundimonas sp. Root1279 TaxID=1736443 RepID=UPI0006F96FF1|nr:hypothetical protein [Brevundimonas sp. Root1279]KQW83854.1 hypothetical protein ASC65_04240 [Brevundimonas sp. Root1279]